MTTEQRAAFEAWMRRKHPRLDLERMDDGYRYTPARARWSGWQAAIEYLAGQYRIELDKVSQRNYELRKENQGLEAAIAQDRRSLGEKVALEYVRTHSASIRGAFADLKGYVLLDGDDDPAYYDHEIRALDAVLKALDTPQPAEPVNLCDCERGHNGMGMAGRECDCPAEPVKGPSDGELLRFYGERAGWELQHSPRTILPILRDVLVHYGNTAQPSVPETITIQEAWEAAGGNPGIKASRQELLDALRIMNELEDGAAPTPPADGRAQQEKLAAAIHYPVCWDTAAYPTLKSALDEVSTSFQCTNEDTHPAQQDAEKVDAQHPDDAAVDAFAAAMKAKLAKKRNEGRGGWQDKEQCSAEWLSELLRGHIGKGDPVDVANLSMMLHQRGESITLGDVVSAHPGPAMAGDDVFDKVVQDTFGASWMGMRVAGWMWDRSYPLVATHYASHWSTGPKSAERLYRESDIRALLKRVQPAREGDALHKLVANDAYACTFQSLGQYRRGLLDAIAAMQKESQS